MLRIPLTLCLAVSTATALAEEIANPPPAPINERTEKSLSLSSEDTTGAVQPRKLPKLKTFPSGNDPYPEEGKRRNLEGRVLVEFALDQRGKPTSVKIIQAEADPILQTGALRLANNIRYDLSTPGFDRADPRPFRVTIKFCLPDCARFATFPGSEELTVRGSPLPSSFRR